MSRLSTHQLPIWAKVEIILQDYSWNKIPTILKFEWMDWMYWKFTDEEHNIYPFGATFELVEWDLYKII